MRRTYAMVSVLTVLAAAAWAPSTDAAVGAVGVDEGLASLPPLATPEDCGFCGNCEDPGKHEFMNEDAGPDRAYGEDDHECETPNWSAGSCPNRHPESFYCLEMAPVAQLDFEGKRRLWALLVTDGEVEADLATELAALGAAVVYNASRRAIQVHGGCDGSLITMSIPLTNAQIELLETTSS